MKRFFAGSTQAFAFRHGFFILALLVLLSGTAHSLSIESPPSVSENTPWGFAVRLDATDSWTKTTVAVDGKQLLDIYSNGNIAADPFNGQFVLKSFAVDEDPKSTGGLVLYVSHFGLAKGAHILSASSESATDSKSIDSFSPLADSALSGFESRLGAVEESEKGYAVDAKALWKKLNRIDANVSSFNGKIAASEKSSLAEVSRLAERVGALEKTKREQEAAAALEEAKGKDGPIAGFSNLVAGLAGSLGSALALVVVIALVLGALLFAKQKLTENRSVYSKKDEFGLPASYEHEQMANDVAGEGKWAAKK